MSFYSNLRDLIKELQEIESIIDFKPERAKDRLFKLIEDLRKEASKNE